MFLKKYSKRYSDEITSFEAEAELSMQQKAKSYLIQKKELSKLIALFL